jgi:hypothetical protein
MFSAFKASLAAMLQLGTRFHDIERVFAGRVLTAPRSTFVTVSPQVSPQQWLHEYMANSNEEFIPGFAAPTKRNECAGYKRRQGPNELRIVGPNYRKQNNRVDRALRKFHGDPAVAFGEAAVRLVRAARVGSRRDALTGIVS